MAVSNVALQAYQNALQNDKVARSTGVVRQPQQEPNSFTETMKNSVVKVNDMQADKKAMIKQFASGETQNVHELMITMQKAGIAMKMTSAVRGKLLEAYKELMRTQF
jgi:flagellar hook-basal body complex protein FliE